MTQQSIQLFRPTYRVDECMEAIRGVLESGWTGTGPKCAEFESQWKKHIGCRNALFVSSATAALHIAVRLLDLPEGSKVATTPLTFVSTNAAILYEKLTPVFCDCGSDLSLKADSVIDAIEKDRVRAVIWVHYGGSVSEEFYKLMDYVSMHPEVKVIEDCAHASGAWYFHEKNRGFVGSRTDTYACFSFHSVKCLPIFDGGILCVPDDKHAERARRLSWLGIDKSTYARTEGSGNELYKWSYDVPELGWKYNGNDIAASIGLVQLEVLNFDNAMREKNKKWYEEFLGRENFMMHSCGSSHHLIVLLVNDREKVMSALKANGIAPGVHYLPNYRFPVFAGFDHSRCVEVEKLSEKILSLPNHVAMERQTIDRICKIIKESGGL
jgi:dTDP-4-amino-4,6-dideoxygalactose transaminase